MSDRPSPQRGPAPQKSLPQPSGAPPNKSLPSAGRGNSPQSSPARALPTPGGGPSHQSSSRALPQPGGSSSGRALPQPGEGSSRALPRPGAPSNGGNSNSGSRPGAGATPNSGNNGSGSKPPMPGTHPPSRSGPKPKVPAADKPPIPKQTSGISKTPASTKPPAAPQQKNTVSPAKNQPKSSLPQPPSQTKAPLPQPPAQQKPPQSKQSIPPHPAQSLPEPPHSKQAQPAGAKPVPTKSASARVMAMKPKHAPPAAPASKCPKSSTTTPPAGGPPKKALPTKESTNDNENPEEPPKKEEPVVKPPPALTGQARRNQIVKELLDTERTYVEWLTICVEQFLKPLRGEESNILPSDKVNLIFSNIEDIMQMNILLLHDLEERMESWSETQCIGDLFIQMAPFLRIYTAYVSNFDDASAALEACEKQPAFAQFLKTRFEDPVCKNQPLRSYLILPVQRIPRYRLLLEDLVKNTEQSHKDYAQIMSSLDAIKQVADQINESVKKHENRMKIIAIQQRINSLMSNLNLVEAHRVFIREGALSKVCRKAVKRRECYLFNDLFFYASILPTGGLLVHRVFSLSDLDVEDMAPTEDGLFPFRVKSLRKSFVLCAETQEEKIAWLNDIFKAIGDLKKSQQTLRLEETGKTGDYGQAPVWQPDKEVNNCPLCNAPFTLFFRKHHCRACGTVVCSNCSTHYLILPIDPVKQRVCDRCYQTALEMKSSQQ